MLFGYKAPVCYTYILLYVTVIVVIHSFFTFWDSAFHNSTNTVINNWDPIDRHTYCIDIFNVTQKAFPLLNDTEDLTCIEIHLLEGLENAATTFGLSALAVAIITWILLTCSQGDKTSPHSCSQCASQSSCFFKQFVSLSHVLFFCTIFTISHLPICIGLMTQ